jgi:tripartite ATP-independent transporter DctM subunit
MEPVFIIIIILAFALMGTPLFAVFAGAALWLFFDLPDTPITGATDEVFGSRFSRSSLLVTIPLFTFAGYLMAESGAPKRLVALSRSFLGWLPGGLAIVCLIASAFFTTFTGGSGITIVAIGGLLFPAMLAGKYEENFSLGLVTTSGSLGLLFPPSLPIIIYGVVAGVVIEKLFLAGIIPGLITVVALSLYSSKQGLNMPRTPFKFRKAKKALREALWEILLPVVVVGGLYTNLMKIHEAAAFSALYVLIIEVFVYKDITLKVDLPRIMRESMTLVGAILVILSAAIGFTAYLIQARVPESILEWMQGWIDSPLGFLLILNVFLLIVGMLMDIFSAIVVVVPLLMPIVQYFNENTDHYIDPYHLGVVFLLNLEIGYMTPPVGLNLFISSFRFKKPLTQIYRSVLPFVGILLACLLLTTYVPELSTALTGLWEEEAIDLNSLDPLPNESLRLDTPNSLDDLESLDSLDDLENEPLNLDDLEKLESPELGKETPDKGELNKAKPLNLDDLEKEL